MWNASRFLALKPSSDGQKHSSHTNTRFESNQEEKYRQTFVQETTAHQLCQRKVAMSQGARNSVCDCLSTF